MLRKWIPLCIVMVCACATSVDRPPTDGNGQPLIYGADDRLDRYEIAVSNADVQRAFESVAAVMSRDLLVPARSGYDLDYAGTFASTFASFGMPLCSDEPFRDQPDPAYCTAFAVGPQHVATAGHCTVFGASCAETAFVFGFHMRDADTATQSFPDGDVYFCDRIEGEVFTFGPSGYEDWSLVRLDRPLSGHPALRVRETGSAESDPSVRQLAVLGHPVGMPGKFAGGASVMPNTSGIANVLESNLDTYGGNSGSPVFSLDASGRILQVEGILVAGNPDFVKDGRCWESNRCPDTGCSGRRGDGGEWVMRSTTFADDLAALPNGARRRSSTTLTSLGEVCDLASGNVDWHVKTCLSR